MREAIRRWLDVGQNVAVVGGVRLGVRNRLHEFAGLVEVPRRWRSHFQLVVMLAMFAHSVTSLRSIQTVGSGKPALAAAIVLDVAIASPAAASETEVEFLYILVLA